MYDISSICQDSKGGYPILIHNLWRTVESDGMSLWCVIQNVSFSRPIVNTLCFKALLTSLVSVQNILPHTFCYTSALWFARLSVSDVIESLQFSKVSPTNMITTNSTSLCLYIVRCKGPKIVNLFCTSAEIIHIYMGGAGEKGAHGM